MEEMLSLRYKPVDCPVREEPTTVRHHELISVRHMLKMIQCADEMATRLFQLSVEGSE